LEIERDYWSGVEEGAHGDLMIEYAADLKTEEFGSGFGTQGQK